jgi:Transglutaminase-like superfamily
MTASDRRRVTTRTLANAGALPPAACGALHPPEPAPARTGFVESVIQALGPAAARLVLHCPRMPISTFADLAGRPDPPLDRLALALAAELREVDVDAALGVLDELGEEVTADLDTVERTPAAELAAVVEVLGRRHGFHGADEDYDDPDRSMLDLVLERGVGLPILLSVLYAEVARRAGVALSGVGLPGHFVVGHFGAEPALLADPYHRGRLLPGALTPTLVRPWTPQETALRMLNNLVSSYLARHDLGSAIRAAELRLVVAGDDREALELEVRGLRARLN